jgi:hypothetical protein
MDRHRSEILLGKAKTKLKAKAKARLAADLTLMTLIGTGQKANGKRREYRRLQGSSEVGARKVSKHISPVLINLLSRWRWAILSEKAAQGACWFFGRHRFWGLCKDLIDRLAYKIICRKSLCLRQCNELGVLLRLQRQSDGH